MSLTDQDKDSSDCGAVVRGTENFGKNVIDTEGTAPPFMK